MSGESRLASDSKRRFSDRVENYVKYRPNYPTAVVDYLRETAGLTPRSIIADIGSGTGISTRLFLDGGNTVYAVEPNADMRAAAERWLATFSGFRSIDGSAEATTLSDASVDLAVAGQAFHWFDPALARREFARILRPRGHAALMWNSRIISGSPFLEAYEQLLLEFGTDYQAIRHDHIEADALQTFFGTPGYSLRGFPNAQLLTGEALLGRLLSSSYAPGPAHPRHNDMVQALSDIFERFQQDGHVKIAYQTQVYVGTL